MVYRNQREIIYCTTDAFVPAYSTDPHVLDCDGYIHGPVQWTPPPIPTPKEKDWVCEHCGHMHPGTAYECDHCGAPKPVPVEDRLDIDPIPEPEPEPDLTPWQLIRKGIGKLIAGDTL